MDVDSSSYIVGMTAILGALLAMAMSAAAEGAIAAVGRSRARAMAEQGQPGAGALLRLLDNPAWVTSTLAVLNTSALALIVAASVVLFGPDAGQLWLPLALLVLAVLLAGRAIPAALATRWAASLAPLLAPFVLFLSYLLAPVRWLLLRAAAWASGPASREGVSVDLTDEELRVLASVVGDARGEAGIAADDREMIASIVTLRQTTAREVMVPRIDIVALEMGVGMLEALDTIISAGHSRIPVYEEAIDNIVGILYAKDLLGYLRDGKTRVPIRDILRPAHFVPEGKKADELLEELQQSRVHIAIVVDEYGGTAGMVTIEDILEEIVGEIQDEYDTEEPFIEVVNEYEAVCNARVDLDDLNRAMSLDLPTDDNDTLGGLIYSELGRVPLVDDRVVLPEQGVEFHVLAVAGRRITKVHVLKERPDAGDDGGGATAAEAEPSENGSNHRVALGGEVIGTHLNLARLFVERAG